MVSYWRRAHAPGQQGFVRQRGVFLGAMRPRPVQDLDGMELAGGPGWCGQRGTGSGNRGGAHHASRGLRVRALAAWWRKSLR